MFKGFKEFISQGNALELAVAVIIGAAFSPIVKAITDVIMAMISQVVGQPNFDSVGQFKFHRERHRVRPARYDHYCRGELPARGRRRLLRHRSADEQGQGAPGQGEGRGGGQGGHRRRALTEIRDLLSANAAKQ